MDTAKLKELIKKRDDLDAQISAARDEMQAELDALFGRKAKGTRKPKTCSNCGKPGHTARTCPDPKKKK